MVIKLLVSPSTVKVKALSGSLTISPELSIEVSPTTASPGEQITISGWLSIPKSNGDINSDGAVDIFDLVLVANAYGSQPGDPNWNPDADVNEDGVVDIFDLTSVAPFWGQRADGWNITVQGSWDGVNWFDIAQVTTFDTVSDSTYKHGRYTYTWNIPSDVTSPSILYLRVYFPGGYY